jgi:hypothetical protein
MRQLVKAGREGQEARLPAQYLPAHLARAESEWEARADLRVESACRSRSGSSCARSSTPIALPVPGPQERVSQDQEPVRADDARAKTIKADIGSPGSGRDDGTACVDQVGTQPGQGESDRHAEGRQPGPQDRVHLQR